MKKQHYKNLWIMVAGHAMRIKSSQQFPWRCFLEKDCLEIPLETFVVIGVATQENMIPNVNAEGNHVGLIAWIEFFGDLEIDENQVATIFLKHPPASGNETKK
jgi:hypothetical protein